LRLLPRKNIRIKFLTKMIYRTKLAVLAYDENRMAEMRGEKRVTVVYQSFSKSKGEKVTKKKKGQASEEWKRRIVDKAIERKQDQGAGDLQENEKRMMMKKSILL
jgi:hypothetical protein